jgi:hypothetical protein
MQYMPSVKSLKYLDGAALGKKHVGILYGDIKSDGLVQYLFIFHIYYRFKKVEDPPLFIISSEENMMQEGPGGGSHFLCVFDDDGHSNLGQSNDWGNRGKFFKKAVEVAEMKLGLKPSAEEN